MIASKTERRIDRAVKCLGFAAVACAMFAAVGIAHGIHDANPTGGWLLPGLAGIVAAVAFAIFWHALTKNVVGFVRVPIIVGAFSAAILVTVVAVGASAQAIATALAGHSALSAELSEQVDGFNNALSEAYAEATSWRGVAESATVLASGFQGRADMEGNGSHGTGKGQGPKWASLKESAEAFTTGAQSLNALLASAKDLQVNGQRQLDLLRDAASRGDQPAFMTAAGAVSSLVDELNAVDPKPIIANTGMVSFSDNGINLTKETADWEAKADKALAERQTIKAPLFRPLSLGEATRRQAFSAASHAWILAGAIDVMPLLFFFVAFLMSREVWMNENVTTETLTPEGRDAVDRQKVKSLRGLGIVREAAE